MVKKNTSRDKVRVLVIGAHPDDCDIAAGGLAALYTEAGHVVKFLSMTNGDTGHHEMGGGELARRRYAETQASAAVLGIEYEVNDQHCGELMPTLENRRIVIRAIRLFQPDLVLTHPPDDYHPDHRNTSLLVQDSAYLVTVPGNLALTPHLRHNPVYGYMQGTVTTSKSFRPSVLADITPVIQKKFDMACAHESQFLEWIPYNQNRLDEVPQEKAAQKPWMIEFWKKRFLPFADAWREELLKIYGPSRGAKIQYIEAIDICPFGAQPDEAARRRLFPFLP
jgi:LmbE family N-acetylglucosaminyl deacetylase